MVVKDGDRQWWRVVDGGGSSIEMPTVTIMLTIIVIAIRKAVRVAGGDGQWWREVNRGSERSAEVVRGQQRQ